MEISELSSNVEIIYKNSGEIFIAEKNGVVIGSICVVIDARLAEGVYAEIVSLIVSETERGQGVGKKLINVSEEWARKRVNKIRVRANETRSSAHTFYENQGFKEVKIQKIFIKML